MSHTTEAIIAGTWGEGCPSCSDSGYDIVISHGPGRRSVVYSSEPTPTRARVEIREHYPTAQIVRIMEHPKASEYAD